MDRISRLEEQIPQLRPTLPKGDKGYRSSSPQVIDPAPHSYASGYEQFPYKNTKARKAAYKTRDPNAPKRPLTAYFRYLGEMRPIIQQEMNQHPKNFEGAGKLIDISRIATERWNKLTQDEQQPYKDAYQAELKEYETAIAAYKAAGGRVEDTAVDNSTSAAGAGLATNGSLVTSSMGSRMMSQAPPLPATLSNADHPVQQSGQRNDQLPQPHTMLAARHSPSMMTQQLYQHQFQPMYGSGQTAATSKRPFTSKSFMCLSYDSH
jgi:hypothetical protein